MEDKMDRNKKEEVLLKKTQKEKTEKNILQFP
jgi:hypothetical protein